MYAGSFSGAEWLGNLVIDRVGKVAIIANSIGFRPVPEGFGAIYQHSGVFALLGVEGYFPLSAINPLCKNISSYLCLRCSR